MASLTETLVPFATYNSLPHIRDVANAPEDHADDLKDLRQLLDKHKVPKGVSIRLIHKHFDTKDGEVMIFDKVTILGHGIAQIMKPVAYEYSSHVAPDMANFEPFLTEFCAIVSKRNLRFKFGLRIKAEDELDNVGWTEFEFHEKRGTIMLQDGMPMPEGDSDFTVSTEWKKLIGDVWPRDCKHTKTCCHGATTCKHCTYCKAYDVEECGIDKEGSCTEAFCLGGQRVLPGTSLFDIVNTIAVQAF
ncbi:uncharacterized protein BDR25DRAFT_332077 [Lindgomyces ingoldianus]|uniref:Uncharacterized protein n=1 Tax=Lindgomyces ingoldianus TaxID=673940 RepID=A0ACB6R618_9PLEO|nr:uncharacterized protein BDR25DRAFT_332077 [Lindgomyces ingoldianus]KAF2474704.1 hypothetical protein BDR25DRAFT_332077 [Lindgomyces ingoldianus]